MNFLPPANPLASAALVDGLRADGIANHTTAAIAAHVVAGARLTSAQMILAMIAECGVGKMRLLATMLSEEDRDALPPVVRAMLGQ
jgi:hypothetical protein